MSKEPSAAKRPGPDIKACLMTVSTVHPAPPQSAMYIFILSALCSLALATPLVTEPKPVSVTVYYEALCPDCETFIPEKLLSTYNDKRYDFTSLITNLTLIPYGFVMQVNPAKHLYRCQHGDSECQGNRLHGCAIKYITDTPTQLNYIACLDKIPKKYPAKQYPIDKCVDKMPKDKYNQILNCYNTDEGWEIFKKNGDITNLFFEKARQFVPYVSFNNEINDDLSIKAVDQDFRKILCFAAGVQDKACSDNAA